MRLPAAVAEDWSKCFSGPFKKMLPALRRLARGDPPAAILPDSLDSLHPPLTTAGSAGERVLIRIALLDPPRRAHAKARVRRSGGAGRPRVRIQSHWHLARRDVDGSGLKLADFLKLLGKAGAKFKYNAHAGGTLSLETVNDTDSITSG